jgi:hypothetical protein
MHCIQLLNPLPQISPIDLQRQRLDTCPTRFQAIVAALWKASVPC